jgi:hypothetical protein
MRYGAATATTLWCFVGHDSTGSGLAVGHSPGLSTATHSVFAFACEPTDDGAATKTADPVALWKATRSSENDFQQQLQNQVRIPPVMFLLPGLGCPNPFRMADQTFDSQFFQEIVASIPTRTGPGNKTPARCGLCAAESFPQPLPLWGPASPLSADQRVNHIYNRISASFGPSTVRVYTEQFTRAVARPGVVRAINRKLTCLPHFGDVRLPRHSQPAPRTRQNYALISAEPYSLQDFLLASF